MKKLIIFLYILIICDFAAAQTKVDSTNTMRKDSVPTIIDLYDDLIQNSSNYKEFKVVDREKAKSFRKKIISKKDSLEEIIKQQKSEQQKLEDNIKENKAKLLKTKKSLKKINKQTDSIAFLGIPLQKSVYHIIVWSLIGLLAFFAVLFFFNYRRSIKITKITKENMKNIEAEYEEYRRSAIEKQQQQGRKILDLQKSVKKNSAENTSQKNNN